MPTYTALADLYQDQIAPGDDEKFLRLLTEADLILLESNKYRWCRSRLTLTSIDGVITLPATHASILGAHLDGVPSVISDEDFEFGPEGPGEIDVGGCAGLRLIDQGLDDDDLRTYKVVGTDGDERTIVALCMKAPAVLYNPDDPDSDLPNHATTETHCPDHGALKRAMLSLLFEESADIQTASAFLARANNRLGSREKHQRGGARAVPNIRPNGPGVRGIRTFR